MNQSEQTPQEQLNRLPLLERYRKPVDRYMQALLGLTTGSPARMVDYHLGFRDQNGLLAPEIKSDGKALRPKLCLLTADATGGKWKSAVPAAAGLELFHNFTLIHDDIQDEDKTRHGKPTVWKLWGEAQAINAGDVAHLLSSQAVLGLQQAGYASDKVLKAHALLTKTGILIVEGQAKDIDFETRLNVTVDEYLQMIRGKTGVLLQTSIEMGALLGNADEQTVSKLRDYGKLIGVAFQIADDGLNIWGSSKETGKPVHADIRKRKKSFPIVYALTHATDSAKTELESIYNPLTKNGKKREPVDDAGVATVLTIFENLDVKNQTQQMTNNATTDAIQSIQSANIGDNFKQDYIQLATTLAKRES